MVLINRCLKPLIILHLLLLQVLTFRANAQNRLGNLLEDSTIIAISSISGNLYCGIDNFLKVGNMLNNGYDTLLFESNNGTITSDSNNLVVILPERSGRTRLMVYGINTDDTVLLGHKYFTVNDVPLPRLTINNQPIETPCTVAKNLILQCDSLGIYISDDIIGSEKWYKVLKFSLGYNYGGYYISHLNDSNILTGQTKDILSLISPDRQISIRPSIITESNIIKELPVYRITIY